MQVSTFYECDENCRKSKPSYRLGFGRRTGAQNKGGKYINGFRSWFGSWTYWGPGKKLQTFCLIVVFC